LLQITEDFGNRVVVAPIAFGGNNIEKNFRYRGKFPGKGGVKASKM
jgi:hypothetical protein